MASSGLDHDKDGNDREVGMEQPSDGCRTSLEVGSSFEEGEGKEDIFVVVMEILWPYRLLFVVIFPVVGCNARRPAKRLP